MKLYGSGTLKCFGVNATLKQISCVSLPLIAGKLSLLSMTYNVD